MELIEGEIIPHKNVVAFAIFGNGPFDKRIFEAILHKFNGKCSILIPTLGFMVIGGQRTIRAVAWLIDNRRKFSIFPSEIWIIIDKEHKKELLENLEIYFQCRDILEEENILKMSISRTGTEYIDLIVVLMGKEKSIEENISILIKEHLKICLLYTSPSPRDRG